jgi:hypothetical protein
MRNEELAAARGYLVLDNGTVIGARGRPIAGWIDKHGYRYFRVGKHDASVSVARLQAFQKYGQDLFVDGIETRHKNGVPLDNSRDNILIGTKLENESDKTPEAKRRGIVAGSEALRKLTPAECKELRAARRNGATYRELMATYGITKSTVSYVVNRKTYSGVAD